MVPSAVTPPAGVVPTVAAVHRFVRRGIGDSGRLFDRDDLHRLRDGRCDSDHRSQHDRGGGKTGDHTASVNGYSRLRHRNSLWACVFRPGLSASTDRYRSRSETRTTDGSVCIASRKSRQRIMYRQMTARSIGVLRVLLIAARAPPPADGTGSGNPSDMRFRSAHQRSDPAVPTTAQSRPGTGSGASIACRASSFERGAVSQLQRRRQEAGDVRLGGGLAASPRHAPPSAVPVAVRSVSADAPQQSRVRGRLQPVLCTPRHQRRRTHPHDQGRPVERGLLPNRRSSADHRCRHRRDRAGRRRDRSNEHILERRRSSVRNRPARSPPRCCPTRTPGIPRCSRAHGVAEVDRGAIGVGGSVG